MVKHDSGWLSKSGCGEKAQKKKEETQSISNKTGFVLQLETRRRDEEKEKTSSVDTSVPTGAKTGAFQSSQH